MRQMRVGFLTYGLDRHPAGIGRYARQLLNALSALADKPEIVLLTTEHNEPEGGWGPYERYALPASATLPALLAVGGFWINHIAQKHGLDIIHDPNGIAPFWGVNGGVCKVVTLHDAFAYVGAKTQNRLDNLRYRWQLPHMVSSIEAVITVSETSRKDLLKYLPLRANRVFVVAEGVDARFKPIVDDDERQKTLQKYLIQTPYLLYVGGINPRKNIARIFEAYSRLVDKYSDIHLVIAGKFQWKTIEIEAAYSRLRLGNRVIFTGYVADSDLPTLFSGAEAFIFPSLYEGFGLPVLEAMACGTAVITSNLSSLPEISGDAALLVNPYNVDEITGAMERIHVDIELREELKRRGIRQAERYKWENTAVETLKIYHQAMEQ